MNAPAVPWYMRRHWVGWVGQDGCFRTHGVRACMHARARRCAFSYCSARVHAAGAPPRITFAPAFFCRQRVIFSFPYHVPLPFYHCGTCYHQLLLPTAVYPTTYHLSASLPHPFSWAHCIYIPPPPTVWNVGRDAFRCCGLDILLPFRCTLFLAALLPPHARRAPAPRLLAPRTRRHGWLRIHFCSLRAAFCAFVAALFLLPFHSMHSPLRCCLFVAEGGGPRMPHTRQTTVYFLSMHLTPFIMLRAPCSSRRAYTAMPPVVVAVGGTVPLYCFCYLPACSAIACVAALPCIYA